MTFLVLQFQNCAPANTVPSSHGGSTNVGIVEDYNKVAIQFVSPRVDIQPEANSTSVSGFCSRQHSGAELNWAIWEGSNGERILRTGQVSCKGGEFAIKVDDLAHLKCGVDNLMKVRGAWGDTTFAYVSRRCQPLVSRVVEAPEGSPYGTSCSIEYSADEDLQSSCKRVCYRDSKVIFNQILESNQCSEMVSSLTGR